MVGKAEEVPVYELLGPADQVDRQRLRHAELFEKALEALRASDLQTARAGFERCLALQPTDLCAQCYLEMIAALQDRPPGPDWQPIIELTSK